MESATNSRPTALEVRYGLRLRGLQLDFLVPESFQELFHCANLTAKAQLREIRLT